MDKNNSNDLMARIDRFEEVLDKKLAAQDKRLDDKFESLDKKLTEQDDKLESLDDKLEKNNEELSFLRTRFSFLELTNRSVNIPEGGQNRFGPRGDAAGESRRDWERERYYRR